MISEVRKISDGLKKLKNDKKALLILFVGIAGMLLIVLSEISEDRSSESTSAQQQYMYDTHYEKEELEELISRVEGAGRTSVMITYECSKENVYAQNITESDEEKGNKKSGEHIIVDSGDDENGLIVKEIYPRVSGVAVVCQGGDNPTVKNEITMLIRAVYDIGSNKICITKMEN